MVYYHHSMVAQNKTKTMIDINKIYIEVINEIYNKNYDYTFIDFEAIVEITLPIEEFEEIPKGERKDYVSENIKIMMSYNKDFIDSYNIIIDLDELIIIEKKVEKLGKSKKT